MSLIEAMGDKGSIVLNRPGSLLQREGGVGRWGGWLIDRAVRGALKMEHSLPGR